MAGRKAASGPGRSHAQPAWKRYAKKDKSLGRQAEATLEMIWSKTEWLTDEHIRGMWEEHRVRKDVVVAWFSEKRKESRRAKSGRGKGVASELLSSGELSSGEDLDVE